MTERDRKYLEKETFKDLIGYCQYLDRKEQDETRLYNCGGLPVSLTLPEGEHDKNMQPHLNHISKTGEILSECGVNALFEVVCNDFEEAITKINYY